MHPRRSDVIGASALALVLFGLVGLLFYLAVVNADPAAMHDARHLPVNVA
ncbi:MAG TPA: hypothetical protein VM344_00225 [Vitreimonas sp.]|nr:hypothetical protein [Vitreimonas sp.]